MCGIAGFAGRGDADDARRMIEAIRYRGPNDLGVFVERGVGFAHARLSIIDLSPAGHQPMTSDDRSVVVVFNGEIYNFQELRDELVAGGRYRFRGASDTEVVLHLYEEIGEKVFARLHGMFAIALYDFREEKLILARDRMGEKPLYWGVFGSTFLFGSELRALMEHPSFAKTLSLEALNKYLAYEYVPTPSTIFKNIFKLEPSTYLVWQAGKIRKEAFWRMDFARADILLDEAVARLDVKLEESVRSMMIADVPLGVFLSGGIDSSTVAYYAQKNSSSKIKTFSVGFLEKSFDESRHAEAVSKHLGTEHHTMMLTASDALKLVPEIPNMLDEPLADASVLPAYLLSRFTRSSVTVALGGDGGDELFAGYPTFHAEKLARLYKKLPVSMRRKVIEPLISRLPVSDADFSLDFKLKQFIAGFDGDDAHRHLRWLGSFGRIDRKKLFVPDAWRTLEGANEFEDADRYCAEAAEGDPGQRLLYLYLRTYLMDEVLVKVDRASMRHALEVRAPFLDHRVVAFVNSLNYNVKHRRFTSKFILKRLMQDRLPSAIVGRPKKGFGIPLSAWLKGELRGFARTVLSREHTESMGIFDHRAIDPLLEEHSSGLRDNRKRLWTLLVFYLWYFQWLA